MNKPLYHLELILNLNTRLFSNTLSGINDQQSEKRISDHNNSLKWIATHTVWARYNLLTFLGKPASNPYNHLFENFKPFNSDDNYPAIEEIKKEWNNASALLSEAFNNVTPEHLEAQSPIKNPIGDFTFGGTIAFLTQHESYDIGQLGLMKKYLTKEAMAYN